MRIGRSLLGRGLSVVLRLGLLVVLRLRLLVVLWLGLLMVLWLRLLAVLRLGLRLSRDIDGNILSHLGSTLLGKSPPLGLRIEFPVEILLTDDQQIDEFKKGDKGGDEGPGK